MEHDMMPKAWYRHALTYAFCFLLVSIGVTLLFPTDTSKTVDQFVFAFVGHLHSDFLTQSMSMITQMGGGVVLAPLGLLAVIISFFLGHRIESGILFVSLLIADRIQDISKEIFARPRPTDYHLIDLPHTFSFPSGHALAGLAFYGMIAYLLARLYPNQRWSKIAQPALWLLFALICFSRIYLGVHYLSDVIGGLCYSAVWYFIVIHLYELAVKRWRKVEQPKRTAM